MDDKNLGVFVVQNVIVFITQIEAFKWAISERYLFPVFICMKLMGSDHTALSFIGMEFIFPNDAMDAIIIWECLYCEILGF